MARKKTSNPALKKLEKDIVQHPEKSEVQFEDVERKVIEDKRQALEGMGIEKEEDMGQEPYPEIEEALKDPEEEEDEDKL
jgi:hypothetical protein